MLRRKLSNPFKGQKQAPQHADRSDPGLGRKPVTSGQQLQKPSATRRKPSGTAPQLSPEIIANNLQQVEAYVRRMNVRVQHLEGLIEHDYSTIGQVTEIKRNLKTTHRNLEKLHFEKCSLLGAEVNNWVTGAMRHAWQAYRRMVTLEEKLRSLPVSLSDHEDRLTPVIIGIEMKPEKNSPQVNTTTGVAEKPQARREQPITYVPTGARGARRSRQAPTAITRPVDDHQAHNKEYRMSGALPSIDDVRTTLTASSRPYTGSGVNPTKALGLSQCLVAHNRQSSNGSHLYDGGYDSDDSLYEVRCQRQRAERRKEDFAVDEIRPEQIPLPKREVQARLDEEEAELAPILIEPDKQRQGSCNGFMITDMVMSNIYNEDYVLPYLHFIKHHELRALKQWLADSHYVRKSAVISRTEKVLHCLELLQTGRRFETIAVIFSRTPRQVESSCHEVMEGLLNLHGFTMIRGRDQEMYTTLWGIWSRKFGNPRNQQPAAYYYGFDWLDVGKVMVTLNLYIGRWREQGKFALAGPSLNWGKFFNAEGTGRFPRMDQPLRLQYSTVGSGDSDEDEGDDEDKDSSIYEDGTCD